MISLTTQKQLSNVKNLSFCYICGKTFNAGDETNDDHVPPKSIFVKQDRNSPLKLKTHKDPCHSQLNLDDEVIGQLFSLLHGKQPSTKNDKLKIKAYQKKGVNSVLAAFEGKNLEHLIWRWLKGFHAALYSSPLPEGTRYAIQLPLPSGEKVEGSFVQDPIKEQHYKFVECIKKNRMAGSIDCIQSNNGQLQYECVWDQLSDNSWCCVFALNLYNWKDLGDVNNFQARGCAGSYRLPSGLAPLSASLATVLVFHAENKDIADPFAI